MEDNKKILKIIIPVVAVIVIIESLVLVKDLKTKKTSITNKNTPAAVQEKVKPVFGLTFLSDSTSMKVGKKYSVQLLMQAKELKMIDAISSYVKYDKEAFSLSNLTYDKGLPTATFSKISSDNGLVVGNFLINDPQGMRVEPGKDLVLAKFDVTPKKAGDFTFEVDTGNLTKESVTMFIDNASKKPLPFESVKLNVSVSTQ